MARLALESSTSLYTLPVSGAYREPALAKLEELIEYVARLLPAEGPVAAFVFQNPLHAFEWLPFDEAVQQGARLFGCQPYLSEARYREELGRSRIQVVDLRSALDEDESPRLWDSVGGIVSRVTLRLTMLLTPVSFGSAEEMRWFVAETEALRRFRQNVPIASRDRIVTDAKRWAIRDLINAGSSGGGYRKPVRQDPRRRHTLWPLLPVLGQLLDGEESPSSAATADAAWTEFALKALWRVCCEGVQDVPLPADAVRRPAVRPRDVLLETTGADSDLLVHELLIRFCAAFTDQGMAQWPVLGRDQGFFRAFCSLYGQPGSPPWSWLGGLAREVARIDGEGLSPLDSIRESLELLGIGEDEWEDALPATMLALKGWGSMIRQMEVRPDRVPAPVPVGTTTEFLAVRLIAERVALAYLARETLSYTGPLCDLRTVLWRRAAPPAVPSVEQRAFAVFQLAQVLGWTPQELHGLSAAQWCDLVGEIEAFNGLERRRIFQRAYERRFRIRALDAVAARAAKPPVRVDAPRFQAVFCIDAREESLRRHLEELCPDVETFGAAGFFSVPMYYRGLAEAHSVASCPIVVRPRHWVAEEVTYSLAEAHRIRAKARRFWGRTSHRFDMSSRTFALGALCTGGLGVLASVPLVARVLFPRWTSWLSRLAGSFVAPPTVTRLAIERNAPTPGPDEEGLGFSLEEMADIGERVLRDIGLTARFARLVLFLGHGSQCLNNPHKAAYDCGACSGNPGGPNARVLAAMLNDARVRELLCRRGLTIPQETVFLGGLHNTGDDTISFYDLDHLPKSHLKDLDAARVSFEKTCARNARERCRRFDSAPLAISVEGAMRHVHARTADLAQPRPEFGNATNAMCLVGRRERLRGLFLDRRSFMHSYDPTADHDGAILARILGAVVPVCQGINLQYFFSAVDPGGWGSGTKLPHNVTSMLGVMDGASSDLRQGLPWQGVEIHEPLRLLFIIESTPEIMLQIMEHNPVVERILRNGWAQLALLDPHSADVVVFRDEEFTPYSPVSSELPRAASSVEWYAGRRDHLDFAEIAQ